MYCGFTVFATLYCAIWDYYMDWGLFRSRAKGTYGLRDQILYPAMFYYFAIVVNFILRFFWLLKIFTWSFESEKENFFERVEILTFATCLGEAMRRTMWALIRVENEFFNNYENYRSIPTIPNLMGKIGRLDKAEIAKLKEAYNF